jgi:hypothetical protein
MSWGLFRWTWRVESPLYVGTSPAGALNRCRLYVPARALWGALTAELPRHEQNGTEVVADRYRQVGTDLKGDYRFTYLYPAEEVGGKWRAWLPEYQCGDGLMWQREDDADTEVRTDRVFRRRILHTRPGTAIDPGSDTAADGSLRETECLQPRWRDETGHDVGPVALVGYVLVRQSNGATKDRIERLAPIRSLFVGGDTRYGLGRLELVSREAAKPADQIFGQPVDVEGDDPIVQSSIAFAHASARGGVSGALEVLSGWDVGKQTALDADGIPSWAPGSRIAKQDGAARFRMDQLGIWRLENADAAPAPQNGETP